MGSAAPPTSTWRREGDRLSPISHGADAMSQPTPESSSRSPGFALMGLGVVLFLGINVEMLPALAFWPARVTFVFGAVVFMRRNRVATEISEQRTLRALNPDIKNHAGDRLAAQQSRIDGEALRDLDDRSLRSAASAQIHSDQLQTDEVVLYEVDAAEPASDSGAGEVVVTDDVSFPVEMQEQASLAEQLEKLGRLRAQGILSDEEFSIAKARLFG